MMTFRIRGLDPTQFSSFFSMDESGLAASRATRVTAGQGRYPCRVSLEDAVQGEELMLIHHTNHDVETPYRNAFAIFVRKYASEAADYVDSVPPILRGRPIALRCYNDGGNLVTAGLSLKDDVDVILRSLLEREDVAYIDAHNAMHGCFAARAERHGS